MSKKDSLVKAAELLDRVRIPSAKDRVKDYPHQFSGGMRQRVMIAMALSLDPDIVIADEPTTALDVTVQAQIMKLLSDLQPEMSMGLILITHDLGVVADVADRIEVMYAGRIVEEADVEDIYARPAHPYTEGLLQEHPARGPEGAGAGHDPGHAAEPRPDPDRVARSTRGATARRPSARPRQPEFAQVALGRRSRCHFWPEVLDAQR